MAQGVRELVNDPTARSVSTLLRNIYTPTTWEILRLAAEHTRFATELAKLFDFPQPYMTTKLARLEEIGIGVRLARRNGCVGFQTDVTALEARLAEAVQVVHPFGLEGITFIKGPKR